MPKKNSNMKAFRGFITVDKKSMKPEKGCLIIVYPTKRSASEWLGKKLTVIPVTSYYFTNEK